MQTYAPTCIVAVVLQLQLTANGNS
jgi:hypothetical protein